MSYIDAWHDRNTDRIHLVERDAAGRRQFREYPAEYIMYYADPRGKHRGIDGATVSRFHTRKRAELMKEVRIHSGKQLYESDLNVVFRCLADNYKETEAPKLHTAFFDIEVDFDKERGFAPPEDPFNPVTSITVYLDWMDQLVTLVIPPKHMSNETADEICSMFTNTIRCESEVEMMEMFFGLIDDADILTGWNSEGFDIPYLVNRVVKIMSKDDTRKFCLWGQYPKVKKYERFGKEQETYELIGRVHMDYLQLYKKYNYEQRQSYKLDSIGEMEVGERKVDYEGTLDQLYNKDFPKFIEYNRQDVMLLFKIHAKLKFLELANAIAHENCVLFPTVMGSVAMIDQAVVNEAHARGVVVKDRNRDAEEGTQAAGAYVAVPKRGMHRDIGAVDLNSLYPSTIRALNMAPETIVGQLRPTLTDAYMHQKVVELNEEKRRKKSRMAEKTEDDVTGAFLWEGLFGSLEYTAVMNQEAGTVLTIDWEDGTPPDEVTAEQAWHLIFNSGQPWVLSANGTIFRTDIEGVIPGLLTQWYSDRKKLQARLKDVGKIQAGVALPESFPRDYSQPDTEHKNTNNFELAEAMRYVESGDQRGLMDYVDGYGLEIREGKLVPRADAKERWALTAEYWDKRQLVKKILLNSAYGSLLNAGSRFYDKRLGQSTTLTGRQIVKHQASFINEAISGKYAHEGDAIVYGDTDSTYFSAWPIIKDAVESGQMEWNKDICVQLYDALGEQCNDSFPAFMERAFHCPRRLGSIIKAGRELVADRGIFIVKKRYAVNIYDKEGKRLDKDGKMGKIKAMGLDLKRSDTPKYIQDFLMRVLTDVLAGCDREHVVQQIREFKVQLHQAEPWTKGSPTTANKLTYYGNMLANSTDGKANMPGHVRGALNWNTLRRLNNDNYSMTIQDGMRVIVCPLKNNPLGYTRISYPTDETRLPQWFKDLPFDEDAMENKLVNEKIDNLLGVLNWNLEEATDVVSTFTDLFQFN